MTTYSPEFQSNIVKKILSSPHKTITSIAKEEQISKSAIYKWLKKHKNDTMALDFTSLSDWTAGNKLLVLQESFNLKGDELNSYCRKKGIYIHNIDAWREDFMTAKKDSLSDKQKLEIKALKKQNKLLSQELRRKEKALAEAAALLILKKKANQIWGEDEED
jgi:transposase-like protein